MIASRHLRAGAGLLLVYAAMMACGKKGPPLPPLLRVPAAVTDLAAQRIGNDVYVTFTVPSANVEGPGSANLARMEVYALTTPYPLTAEEARTEQARESATLVANERVRPPLPPSLPAEAGSAGAPPLPVEPGLVQGGPAVIRDALTGDALVPVALPSALPDPTTDDAAAVPGPIVAPDAASGPKRYYFVVGVTASGRYGATSAPVAVPISPSTGAPSAVRVTYDERAFTLQWSPSPDARLDAAVPVEEGLLPSKPVVPPVPATKYDVYAVERTSTSETPARPVPLNAEPLTATELVLPGVAFGRERCFTVRPVDVLAGIAVRGPASTPSCVTPVDTFAPAAPQNLQAVAGAGTISLIWEANAEADLAGYIVLRGDGSGDTLSPLTPSPIPEPRFDDTTVQPGVRYVYAVVAVDNASPSNRSTPSNRAEETAR